jgi:TonB-linked SusC/RagA family outer membrane protein
MIRDILMNRTTGLILGLLLAGISAQAQQLVKGSVVSMTDKTSMPGVSVILKGTSIGTATDATGAFSLEVPGPESVIVFSFIGFQSEEITVGQQSTINVMLSPSLEELMEVVVVGYSEKKKTEITGAVSNLTSEEIKGVTGSNLEYMLQGKVAGVQVTSPSGEPGASSEIRIRGISSITADRQPLFVVDGIIGGTYNPNDIESVTVLKDAAAIALYGSRANAGVIVVTTKRGTSEKPIVTYRTTFGKKQITTGNFELMNSQELYDTERLMFASSAAFNLARPASVLETDTDWLGLAYDDGVIQNHNISLSGKTGKVGYYLAADYYDEDGTLLSTGYKRYNFRSNLDFQISKAVKLTTNLNITRDNRDSYHWRWPYQPFLYLPYDTPYDENGNLRYVDGTTDDFLTRDKNNILQSAEYNDYNTKGLNLNGDVVLGVDILPWLSVQSRNRIGYATYRGYNYEDLKTIEGFANDGVMSFASSEEYTLISTNLVRLNKDFGDHHLSGFVGFEGQQYGAESSGGGGYGIVSGIKVPSGIASPQALSGTKTETRAMSFLSEVNYDFREKYFASVSFRRDGSSIFGSNKRWGNFGAVSASWLLSKEDFFAPLSGVATSFKIRGSYGIVGNDALDPFSYLAKYAFASQYNGGTAGYPDTLPNPDLGWEQTKATDVGLEVTFLNRLDLTIDFFNKNTDDLLLAVQLPSSQGITQVYRNAGRVVNNGMEVGIGGDIIRKRDFRWSVNFNIGTAQNEVKELADGTNAVPRTYDGLKQSVQVGHDINSWYLPKWAGVNPDNGDPQWESAVLDSDGNVTSYELTNVYADASSTESLQFVGSATPKFFGGLNTSVSYKRFTLNVSSAFQSGNMIYHRTREFIDGDGALFNFNMMKLADGWSRWMNPGDNATHPKPVFGGNQLANKPSSRYLEDGSFWRIRNITLNYDIPANVLSKIKMSQANIFISADNLFTFTKFSGLDPETSSIGINNVAGLSDFKYPISKQFLVGLQISF